MAIHWWLCRRKWWECWWLTATASYQLGTQVIWCRVVGSGRNRLGRERNRGVFPSRKWGRWEVEQGREKWILVAPACIKSKLHSLSLTLLGTVPLAQLHWRQRDDFSSRLDFLLSLIQTLLPGYLSETGQYFISLESPWLHVMEEWDSSSL